MQRATHGKDKQMPVKRGFLKFFILSVLLFMPLLARAADVPAEDKTGETAPVMKGGAADEAVGSVARQDEQPPDETAEEEGIADPLEPWNRAMFTFNDKFYFWVLKPVSKGYGAVIPEWGRVRVRNVFRNILMPVRFVNSLLQLKLKAAGVELVRFVANTAAGFGGMFDVAGDNPGLKAGNEDFGQTLGVYGIGDGFYIVWPFLGPSSLRDTAGLAGDYFLSPVSYITPLEDGLMVRSYEH